MADRYITPSKITAWLDCAHFLTLKHQVESGLLPAPEDGALSAFSRLLMDKGMDHELACLAEYDARGLRVHRVAPRGKGESFAAWTARVGDVLSLDVDVLYQVPLIHDGVRGVADFLLRVVDDSGLATWEPVDSKLAREQAKPGHVLQLCFYADAVEAATGRRPAQMHLWLGSGRVETLRVGDFAAYWRRLRSSLATALEAPVAESVETSPEPCAHCDFCEFADVCTDQWRAEDSLVFIAGIRTADRDALTAAGVQTRAGLATVTDPVPALAAARQQRLTTQAALQVAANEGSPPPFQIVEPGEDPTWGRGFEQLPEPDAGDVFLDFEGHPFWRADRGLFFLFGLIERGASGDWVYRTWWAHDVDQEGVAAGLLVEHLAARRAEHPAMHVYHYNHTERSALQSLCAQYGVAQVALNELVETGAFVDLLLVARNAIQVGAESYGLKALEKLTDYLRLAEIDKGAGAVLEYEAYLKGSTEALSQIAAYNEDDVRATRALRDWLVVHRPQELVWREAELVPEDTTPELDAKVVALHAFGEGTVEHLMGDVLGYWKREWLAYVAPQLARCEADTDDLLDEPDVLAGLVLQSSHERLGKNGKPLKHKGFRHSLPEQEHAKLDAGDDVLFRSEEATLRFGTVVAFDDEAGTVDLTFSGEPDEIALPAGVVVRNTYVRPKPKPEVLDELADLVLDGSADVGAPLAMSLLRRDLPRFTAGGGPAGGVFCDDVDSMIGWVGDLDESCVAVQGPPGTGKTYRASHLVHALIKSGKRVGITGPSHYAVDNLLEAVVGVFSQKGELDELCAVRKPKAVPPSERQLPSTTYTMSNSEAAKDKYNLVAGTTWLFASKDVRAAPVDVLFVDEAGQVSIADALATTRATSSMLLFGDPLQLPQVAQAAHPKGAGESVLQHVIGDAVTMRAERGVFITQTRRMHPDVCGFISNEIYEGRLTSHASCGVQTTDVGTGLRWIRAEHVGCETSSEEEAELVVREIELLIGKSWTDAAGAERSMTAGDVIVVAPYNDQVDLLQAMLDANPVTAGVAVGTVDRFQGREAAVVFFSMTTSSAADMPRNGEFLFSRNRLNVAVSRARCVVYLVCTEALLGSRARNVEEMRLISTLCAFAEESDAQTPGIPAQREPLPSLLEAPG